MSTARIDRSTTSFEENQCIESPTLTSSTAAPPPPPKPKVDGQADQTETWNDSFQQAGLLGGLGRRLTEKAGAREKLAGLKDGQTETVKFEQAIPIAGALGLVGAQELEVSKQADGYHFAARDLGGLMAKGENHVKAGGGLEGKVEFHAKTLDEATELVKRFGEVLASQAGGTLLGGSLVTGASFASATALDRIVLDPQMRQHLSAAEVSPEFAAKLGGEPTWAALSIAGELKGKASVTYRLERGGAGELEFVQRLTAKMTAEGSVGFSLPKLEGGMALPNGLEQTLGPALKALRAEGEVEGKVVFEVRQKPFSSQTPKVALKVAVEAKGAAGKGGGGGLEFISKLSSDDAARAAAEVALGRPAGALRLAKDVTVKAHTYELSRVSSEVGAKKIDLKFGVERESRQSTGELTVPFKNYEAVDFATRLFSGR